MATRKSIAFDSRSEKDKEASTNWGHVDYPKLYEPIPKPFTIEKFSVSTDSGAHTLYKKFFVQGAATEYARINADYSYLDTKEFKEFLDNYIQHLLVHKELYDFYVTLDIINNPQKSWEITKYIESFGLTPIPVFHNGEDISWLHKMLDEYPYFGISGLGQDITKPKFKAFGDACFRAICDSHGVPRAKVHGFAMGTPELLSKYPWYSADQSTWTYMSRVGSLLVPRPNIKHGKILSFDYLSRYLVLPVTQRRRFEPRHVTHLLTGEQLKWLTTYVEQEKFTLEEAQQFYHVRDVLNIRLFYNIQQAIKKSYKEQFDYEQGGNILYAGTPSGASSNLSRMGRLLYDIQIPELHWLCSPVYNKHLQNCLAYKASALKGEDFRCNWTSQDATLKIRSHYIPQPKPKVARKQLVLDKPPPQFKVTFELDVTISAASEEEAICHATNQLAELGITARHTQTQRIIKIQKRPIVRTATDTSFDNFL